MRDYVASFLRRGASACGIGPLVLVVLYLVFQHKGVLESLTVNEVVIGIVSLTALAFVAGGMNFIYEEERLPLMVAITIHGVVLYISYLLTYLVNGWLERGIIPMLVFTGIFVVGYIAIWIVIYSVMKRRITRLNEKLKEKQNIDFGV